MDLTIIAYLIILARKRGGQRKKSVTYSTLCRDCKLDLKMNNLKDIATLAKSLTKISSSEALNGRPLISALVVNEETGIPGDGFYTLAKKLGKFNGKENSKKAFFKKESVLVRAFWQKI